MILSMKKAFVALLLICPVFSFGLPLNEVVITGENITNCGLNADSVNASLNSAARYNRIKSVSSGNLYLYHQVNSLGQSNGFCSANIYLEISAYSRVLVSGKSIFTKVVLCSNSFILTGDSVGMQTRVNDAAKRAFELCIVEVEKL